jgi:YHS domain-containing protein
MKFTRHLNAFALTVALVAVPAAAFAADEKKPAAKPYKLENCLVSEDEKLGEMGKPFVFEYKGQEIKLCCKSCKKDFDKDPDKFIKKMHELEKKAAAKPTKPAQPADPHAGHNH